MADESDRGVFIMGSTDKRQATATPILTRDGEIPYIQVLWRGKTDRVHVPGCADPRIVQMHSAHKMQVRHTFLALLNLLAEHSAVYSQAHNLPANQAWLLLVDNVSSHLGDAITMLGPHLASVPAIPNCYLWLGLPRRSHVCNPGDQQVNSALRRVTRRQSKARVVDFVLALCEGTVEATERLDSTERTVKACLVGWLIEFLDQKEENCRLVLSSWKSVLTIVDPNTSAHLPDPLLDGEPSSTSTSSSDNATYTQPDEDDNSSDSSKEAPPMADTQQDPVIARRMALGLRLRS